MFRQRWKRGLDACERLLGSQWTRLVLSLLIIISVLPDAAQSKIFPAALAARPNLVNLVFLIVFGLELGVRATLYARRWRRRQARGSEALLLALDVLAVLSFLPLESALGTGDLRLLRLTRLLLLLGYWGKMARELFAILLGPERRIQVIMVVFLGLVLSFGSAVLVTHIVPRYDFNGDGETDARDVNFFNVLWWSFRQVQDPGNLVADIDKPPVVVLSLLLTFAGLLLFSFLIGIGTGAIDELMVRAREQPVGLQGHTVILGLTAHCEILLEELAMIYRKNLRPFRAAVLGPHARAPAYLHRPLLRSFQYRHGDPVHVASLDRVNIRDAKRVLILGADPADPDGEVIAAILATRERNPDVDLYPDVEHERNFRAVRSAGGPRTHLVGSGAFLGYYIAQNVIYPGVYRAYRHLLTSSGCEIYTYLFSQEERRSLLAHDGASFDPLALHRLAYRSFGVTWVGLFTADEGCENAEDQDLRVLLNPTRGGHRDPDVFDPEGRVRWTAVRGLIGLALRWEDLRRLARRLIESPVLTASTAEGSGPGGHPGPPLQSSSRSPDPPRTPPAALTLRPARAEIERILICGASLRVPRVVFELIGFSPRIEITVTITDDRHFRDLARVIQEGLAAAWKAPVEVVRGEGTVDLRLSQAETEARVLLLRTDWTDRELLAKTGAVDLETADAVLLLPRDSGAEPLDGGVALDCLEIANLVRSRAIEPRPRLHVLGMVQDPVKGDLLESRLSKIAGDGSELRFTIISSARARHYFVMQNVFVRGLNPFYLALLSSTGQQLGRFVPRDASGRPPAGDFDPGDLAARLLANGMVLFGFETRDPENGLRLELDPRQMQPGTSMPWAPVRALYVLGSPEDAKRLV